MRITKKLVRKVRDTVDAGLVGGLGQPTPGEMCVEAAVCFALGLPHSDTPPCVSAAVREYKIALNDAGWSSPQARAKGMRALAIAQLGSETIDPTAFATEVAIETVRIIIPDMFDALGLRGAEQCREATTLEEARDAANAAFTAYTAAYAAAARTAYVARANTIAAAAAYAARAAIAPTATRVNAPTPTPAQAAANAAYASATASAYAARAVGGRGDEFLRRGAEIALAALRESPGYRFLHLLGE